MGGWAGTEGRVWSLLQANICYLSSASQKKSVRLWGMVAISPISVAVPARSLLAWRGTWVWFGGSAFLVTHQSCRIPWGKSEWGPVPGSWHWTVHSLEGLEGLRRQVAPQKSENKTKTTVAGAISSMEVRVGIPLLPFLSLGE